MVCNDCFVVVGVTERTSRIEFDHRRLSSATVSSIPSTESRWSRWCRRSNRLSPRASRRCESSSPIRGFENRYVVPRLAGKECGTWRPSVVYGGPRWSVVSCRRRCGIRDGLDDTHPRRRGGRGSRRRPGASSAVRLSPTPESRHSTPVGRRDPPVRSARRVAGPVHGCHPGARRDPSAFVGHRTVRTPPARSRTRTAA